MEPVRSNITSKSCAEGIGSNCVEWAGGPLCSADLCKGNTTLTDVITAMDNKICGTNQTSPCYTGNWIDFTTSIQVTGTGGGASWNINNFGAGENGQIENRPMYKWAKDGDLSLRGCFHLTYSPTTSPGQFVIPLVTIPPTCFPANWNASQTTFVTAVCYTYTANKALDVFFKGAVQVIYPTGQLVLIGSFTSPVLGGSFNEYVISFGGLQFNLA